MADQKNPNLPPKPENDVLDRVQDLTWGLLDEDLNSDEIALLDSLLLSDDAARTRYLECVQLHVGLHEYFAEPSPGESNTKSPVLGFLGEKAPIDLAAPASDETI